MKGSRLISLLLAAALLAAVAVPAGSGASATAPAQVAKKKCKAKSKGKSGAAAKKRKCKKKGGSAEPPKLRITPNSHDFGTVPFPATSPPSQAFVVQNVGGSPSGKLTTTLQDNSAVGVVPAASLSITANTCSAALPKGGQCSITVQFNPPLAAVFASGLLIVTTSPGNPVSASIIGKS